MILRIFFAALLLLAGYVGYKIYIQQDLYNKAVSAPEAYTAGAKNADLSVVMFLDYQCIYCRESYPVLLDAVRRDGHVRMILRPLPYQGKISGLGGQAVYAAGRQGKFFEMHDALIQADDIVTEEAIIAQAKAIGLDEQKFLADFRSEDSVIAVAENVSYAGRFGLKSTPAFLMGRILYVPTGRMPTAEDFLRMFAEARGQAPAAAPAPAG